jgi:hypothetical protein
VPLSDAEARSDIDWLMVPRQRRERFKFTSRVWGAAFLSPHQRCCKGRRSSQAAHELRRCALAQQAW